MQSIEKDIISTQVANMNDEEQKFALSHFSTENLAYELERRSIEQRERLRGIQKIANIELH